MPGHEPAIEPTTDPATEPAAEPDHEPAIEAVDLVKHYGRGAKRVSALSGVSFRVRSGIVFALLGPNGAGKSSTVRILATLSAADAGHASIAGVDLRRYPDRVRRIIGYVPQRPAFDPVGTGLENLVLAGRIHGMTGRAARHRAGELLERFDLGPARHRRAGSWSGGMQRKLDVALGLMHRPRVLFLDEPTTGLDPQARVGLWAEIAAMAREDGVTVLLTTHYLEEADQLAAQLAIVDDGRIVAAGSPERLKHAIGGDSVRLGLAHPADLCRAWQAIETVPGLAGVGADGPERAALRARVTGGARTLPEILAALAAAEVELASVTVSRASLDDVYLHHTGRAFRDADRTGRDQVGARRPGTDREQVTA